MRDFLQKRRLRLETRARFLTRRIKTGEKPKLVVFLHIPKTAGTSTVRYLTYCLGSKQNGKFVRIRDRDDIYPQINSIDTNNVFFVSGHIDFSHIEAINSEKFIFTFLREPENRVQSWIVHSCYLKEKFGLDANDCDVRSKDSHGLFPSICMTNNFMVRQLSGSMDEVPQTDARWRELLEQAKANLGKLDYVGFQETFSYDFAQIVGLIGLPPFKTAPRINVTSDLYKGRSAGQKELEFDATTREKTRELTRWDNELYDYALSEFR